MLGYRYITKDESIYRVRNNFYHFYEPSTKQHGTPASIKDVCNILNKQKIVALFKGAPEAGPRALGHRSLLFDPRNLQGKKIINSLKKYENGGTIPSINAINVTTTPQATDSQIINVTFSGNILSDDFIIDEAIPKIKDAIVRGADIGIRK